MDKRTILNEYERPNAKANSRSAWANARNIVKVSLCFYDYSKTREEHRSLDAITTKYRKNSKGEIIETIELTVDDMFPDKYVVETTDVRGEKRQYNYMNKETAESATIQLMKDLTSRYVDWKCKNESTDKLWPVITKK